ncbi:MAG TPA: bifunctional UDP-N-acetylglucosamine diphosphorylase/glucosamine-1-phosphate N-acetyltransferase GlmU [Candidatus Acidoferrales bacterium]|nr:bifunctional UDP-N-acetylglucosamine diphosphorylase/glucosamine-1-phosphate N-acetyltransferase GlmU [Candidatus Acidoferrales bacterium]
MSTNSAERGVATIVLAAGLGTRMKSRRAKVLHEICGEPIIVRLVRRLAARAATDSPIVVAVGHQAGEVEAALRSNLPDARFIFAAQKQLRGTGDAARTAVAALPADFDGPVQILYGDMPPLADESNAKLRAVMRDAGAALGFISVVVDEPANYGRVVRDKSGAVQKIVEARDASPRERQIREINAGYYCASRVSRLREWLAELKSDNDQNEYYLTDIVSIARGRGEKVEAWVAGDASAFAGINSREELAQMEAQVRASVNRKLMESGVTLVDPATAYISEQVEIAPDCIIGPNVQILGKSRIGEGVRIDGTAWLSNVTVGPRCHLKLGVRAEDCVIGEQSEIGPFANLRAGTELEGHNRIGNFVETKKARIGRGTKASHLSYLGDTTIGADTNVGCGVITVNYDGYDKHHTHIGSRCMIGCDTQLIAPVKVGDDVYVASGTTIVREVADGALVMSHHPQREKVGWMAAWRKRHGDSPDGTLKRSKASKD